MKLRRVRDTSSGQWAKSERATTDKAGTVTETARPANEAHARCPHCGHGLTVSIDVKGKL